MSLRLPLSPLSGSHHNASGVFSMPKSTTRTRVYIGLALTGIALVAALLFQPSRAGSELSWASIHVSPANTTAPAELTNAPAPDHVTESEETAGDRWPYAYATFLSESGNYTYDWTIKDPGVFFNATRVLAYQLLHQPSTRTRHDIPFLVLVTPSVPQVRRDRLTADGCTVIEVSPIQIPWVPEGTGRWGDVASKLHLVNMTEYERIAFIDADMLLRANLDGIFLEDGIKDPLPVADLPNQTKDDEAPLPKNYVFAAAAELETRDHAIPPVAELSKSLNAGFWVTRPDPMLFNYYISVLNTPWRFWPGFPEQAMLNYAHRADGNMPWTRLRWDWNVNFATAKDLEAGAKSLHGKWWMKHYTDVWNEYDLEIERLWQFIRDDMLAFWEQREGEVWTEQKALNTGDEPQPDFEHSEVQT